MTSATAGTGSGWARGAAGFLTAALVALWSMFPASAGAFTLNVVDENGAPVSGFRWLVEQDNTNQSPPGVPSATSLSLSIHKSHARVRETGRTTGSAASVNVALGEPYFVSVLPDGEHQMGGAPVAPNQTEVTVVVNSHLIPTAQVTVLAFVDQNPINNGPDLDEPGLGGALVTLNDFGGPITQDIYGNPLGTRYDALGNVVQLGNGFVHTLTQAEFAGGAATNPYGLKVGEAVIKNIAPGKYGVVVTPPRLDDNGAAIDWIQTTTIEGTLVIDAWVSANEPNLFVEGFGTGFKHVAFGFVKTGPVTSSPVGGLAYEVLPWNAAPPAAAGSISGTLRWNHFAKPPFNQGFFPGEAVPEAWVGLDDPLAQPAAGEPAGLVAVAADANGHFTIPNVPDGTYRLVWWDKPLDGLFGFASVTVAAGAAVDLGEVLVFRWFGTLEGTVFYDRDRDGFRDPGEPGIPEQNLNLRFRDGSLYQTQPTDGRGEYVFSEVFPFFKWLVAEVDFARYQATGITAAVDNGGAVPLANGWIRPSFDKLTPQPQVLRNPNTGNRLSRTERGPVLTQAMHLFLNQVNVVDWGKANYPAGQNGGVSGVVYYSTTRAEDDPAFGAPEPWEPGIPDVQVALYVDNLTNASGRRGPDGRIDDVNGDRRIVRADVDNYPFGWRTGGRRGPEDLDRNGNRRFDPGDAVAIVLTDSWDRNNPTECVQNLPVIHGQLAGRCADNYSTWNQVRPGLFDGGYAFNEWVPGGLVSGAAPQPLPRGTYIVEAAAPKGYELVKEEDKNVDFGDAYTVNPLLLPPPCVGARHLVPPQLTLFPGVDTAFAGRNRPLCDLKQIRVLSSKNAAVDFYFFTAVPKAARAVGFANNDLAAEFNMASPNFGEKLSPAWIPVAFKDWTGREITRVYTDEYGSYNALLPSTYTMNAPQPSGVSPGMLTLVLNDPIRPDGTVDPYHNPVYSVTPWTFQYMPGQTSYLDTPLVPLAAFASHGGAIDTEAPTLTPAISWVSGPESGGGPVMCSTRVGVERRLTIQSVGLKEIVNPNYSPGDPANTYRITRNYGFGNVPGQVTIDGVPLTVVSWNDAQIVAEVPDAVTATGRLLVTRGAPAGVRAEVGVTFNIVDCATTPIVRVPAQFATIQAAIDDPATAPGSLVLVSPGSYNENVIMFKPVLLQGAGAGGTFIDGNPTPVQRLQEWHQRVDSFGAANLQAIKAPTDANEAPAIIVFGETAIGVDVFDPGYLFDIPGQARVDGFTLSGSKAGGGLWALSGVRDLVVSNNVVTGNQGIYAGGINLGIPDTGLDGQNARIALRFNKIHRNGGVQGAGGVAANAYSTDYAIEDNIIAGNFSRFNGGGIAHRGYSPGVNVIRRNRILYNEESFGALLARAGDGGGIFVGDDVVGDTGTGNVTIDANLIQGNLSGAGHGGGIRAFSVNANDVAENPDLPDLWHHLVITNNVIANNVAGYSGAGISLQDVARATIDNNTIVNNDTTATSALAATAGQPTSTAQPSGVVAHAHSAPLQAWLDLAITPQPNFSNPVLRNNVIRNNRSFYNDATLNGGAGGLAPNQVQPVWDLQVVGVTPAAYLNPDNCVLTNLSDALGADYNDGTNLAADPVLAREVVNELTSATVLDEGGNATTVRFKPLLPTVADYHLRAGSPAIDAGIDTGATPDIDGEARPAGLVYDIGADERVVPVYTAVTVEAPNGGEVIPSGGTFTISWGAPAGADHYTVEISVDNGASWTVAASGHAANFLAWTAPVRRANLTQCLVRVTAFDAVDGLIGSDVSDAVFTVEVVRLLDPNGSEILIGGTNYTVRWTTNVTSAPVTSVNLEWMREGVTWAVSASGLPNTGSHVWTVPGVPVLRTGVWVRVTLLNGTTVVGQDASDGMLTIRPPMTP